MHPDPLSSVRVRTVLVLLSLAGAACSASMPTARWGAPAGAIDGRPFVAGGRGGADPSARSSMEVYNPATNSWVRKAKRSGAGFDAFR
jgi:Kelch motif